MFNPFKLARAVFAKGQEKEKNITCGFYKSIQYTCGTECYMNIAASSFYRIFINGKFFAYGPVRCGHGTYRVDNHDLSSKLICGENHIAIEVVGYNNNTYYVLNQPSFLQCEIILDHEVAAATGSDRDFTVYILKERVRKVQKYSFQRTFCEAYRLGTGYAQWRIGDGSAETKCDIALCSEKKLTERNLPYHTYDAVYPSQIEARGTVRRIPLPKHPAHPRSFTQISDSLKGFSDDEMDLHLSDEAQTIETVEKEEIHAPASSAIAIRESEFEIDSFPCQKAGFLAFEIDCKEDGLLYLFFDEKLIAGDVNPLSMDCVNFLRFEVKKGKYSFITFEPYALMHIKFICMSGSFVIHDFHFIEYICPVPITDTFYGENQKLQRVWDAAKETFLHNAPDIYTDCPTRERAGWLCDSFFIGRAEKALTGQNLVEKVFFQNFLLSEGFEYIPAGMLPMCYPADHYDGKFIPNWAMWFVIELEDYWKRTSDREMVDGLKDKVYALLEYFKSFENELGLLERLDGWIFVEWSKANDLINDVNFPTNMCYAGTLQAAGRLYQDDTLIAKGEAVAKAVRDTAYDGEFFIDNAVRENGKLCLTHERTETCQYYAFFFDVATPNAYPELWRKLTDDFGPNRQKLGKFPEIYPSNAFIGNFLRLDVLTRYGKKQQVISEMEDYFYYMAEKTGTLWENINDCSSCDHGFASYAAFLLDCCHDVE